MQRLPDWPERLNAYVAAPAAFIWGEADCCLWACGGVAAMTGVDPGAWFRGRYSDQAGAEATLRDFARGGLLEAARALAERYGKNEVPPLQGQRGDLVLCEGREMAALGLCIGPRAMLLTPNGKRFVPQRRAVAAFRI